jgi:acetyl esterase/lipase
MSITQSRLASAFTTVLLLARLCGVAQAGRIEVIQVTSPGLRDNLLGDSATRNVTVYLPSAYDEEPDRRFPVVYLLHGYLGTNAVWIGQHDLTDASISGIEADLDKLNIRTIADELIANRRIRPMILVAPDCHNAYGGSWYTNSPVTGNWEDFVVQDLVRHIDAQYRTLPDRDGRAIAGHSMGGHGAIKIAMKHPDVYCALYAMAPAWVDFTIMLEAPSSASFIEAAQVTARDAFPGLNWRTRAAIALAAAIAPRRGTEPFLAEFPLDAAGNRVEQVCQKWFEHDLATTMLSTYKENLRKYRAITVDCGTDDLLLPMDRAFSDALTKAGVPHTFQVFDGDHTNCIASQLANSVLPLFCRTFDDDTQKRSPAPPTTISKQAQEFLSQDPPIPTKSPQTLEDWQDRRVTMEKIGKSLYDEGRHKYDGSGEILRFKRDHDVEVLVYKMTPVDFDPTHQDKAILHIHGGGYCFMSPESTFCVCAPVANLTGLRVYCVKYRLAPEHPYPAGLDDCVSAYATLLDTFRPENLGILGESAGAALGLTMLLKARLERLPMPAALGCISPCVDVTMSSDTITTLSGVDPVLLPKLMRTLQDAYAAKADRRDPLLSPIRADFAKDFPPTIIQTGTRDLLLSDCVRLHEKMKAQGVNVELSVREAMWHGYHILPSNHFPEATAAFEELAAFFRLQLRLE